MCEIVTFDPERHSNEIITNVAAQIEDQQGHGMGIVAVHESPDGFEYDVWKRTYPDWFEMHKFLERMRAKDAWRFVLHGRRKTAGKVCHKNAHPLRVNCDKCEFDWVVHNGSVRQHQSIRGGLTSAGHNFETGVDSEVIAHKVQELPESIEDHSYNTYSFRGNLNYLLFSENGILIHNANKYHLTDEMLMTCSRTSKMDDAGDIGYEFGKRTKWMLVTPGDDGPEIETQERSHSSWQGNRGGGRSRRSTSASGSRVHSTTSRSNRNSQFTGNYGNAGDGSSESGGQFTVTYENHASFGHLVAIKVAPGVMRVIDDELDTEEYVFRDHRPRLYYYYAPDDAPDNLDYLEELAERDQMQLANYTEYADEDVVEAEPVGDTIDEEVEDEVVSETTRVVANTINNLTVEEVQEFQQELRASWREGRLQAEARDD